MDHADSRNSLLILGVHLKSEGYPNTLYRLRDLEASGLFRMVEINMPMWNEATQNRHGFSRLTRNFWQAVFSHITVMARFLSLAKRPERIYVPYPGVFLLFLLSCLPARLKPQRVVVDVFISLYDTIVLDRSLLTHNGFPAKILKWVERRAYDYADKLVVDTQQSAKFLCSLFGLPETKVVVAPLSIDEINFRYSPYLQHAGICRVLFIGTMVPLHGIGTILEAASLLSDRPDIHFKLIGDGQETPRIESWLHSHVTNLDWERAWQPSTRIAEEIGRADICLGIFGDRDKAQRVCPFKIYAYASVGRAIITGETDWLKETTVRLSCEPFAKVPVKNSAALAAKITQLADDPALRIKLAANSHEFFNSHLGSKPALKILTSCLLEH